MMSTEDLPPTLEELKEEAEADRKALAEGTSNRRGDYQAHLPMGRFRYRWQLASRHRVNWRWFFYTVRRTYLLYSNQFGDKARRHSRHAKSLNYNDKRPSAIGTRSLRSFLNGRPLPRHLRTGAFHYPLKDTYNKALEEQTNNAIRRARTNGRQKSKKAQAFAYHDDEATQNWRFYMED